MKKITLLILGLSYVAGMLIAQNEPQTVVEKQFPSNETQEYREGFSKTLIDFSKLDPENDEQTELDYSDTAFMSFPSEEAAQLKLTYALNSWKVRLKNSIQFPDVIKNSFARAVKVNDTATKYAGDNILGFRVAFPNYPFELVAEVIPPFRANPNSDAFDEKGVLSNVGIVRSAYITVYGLNQFERLYVVIEDSSGQEYEYPFGDLRFIGWKTLEWTNPNYLREVRSREIQSLPVYPQSSSNRRFKSIKVVRSGSIYGGADFVAYVRDIKLTFDKAVDDLFSKDINNEDVWGIVKERIGIRDTVLYKRGLVQRALEYLEERKKYNYPEDLSKSEAEATTDATQETQEEPQGQ